MYTGGLFQGEYARSAFVAEPVHNLVHRDVIEPSGATFVARRGGESREFLASTDPWFRPVNFYVGPDGALYVIDYYRARIEHPEWTASEFHKNPAQFTLGRDRGRIYRIVPDAAPAPVAAPRLGTATDAALVDALSHDNLWWRRTAQRLLLDRRPPQIAPLLETLARAGRVALRPPARAVDARRPRACSTIGLVVAGAGRHGGGRAGERPAPGRAAPGRRRRVLQAAVLARAVVEQDARARFQLLATLGGLDSAESRAAQQQLFFAHVDDPWMQVAALVGRARPRRGVPGGGAGARQRRARAEVRRACGVFHAGRIGRRRHARTGSRGRP